MVKSLRVDDGTSGTKTKTKHSRQSELEDWARMLAIQQKDVVKHTTSKSERIEKRLAKKKHTADNTKQKRQNKTKTYASKLLIPTHDTLDVPITMPVSDSKNVIDLRTKSVKSIYKASAELSTLSQHLEQCVILIKEKRNSWQKPYVPALLISNSTSKRRRQQLTKNMEGWFQPQKSNYGGIGLARPSLLIALDDPSWQAKLEEEFIEHIPGFYGKQRTKSMKKQLDGQMLWRQLQKQKVSDGSSSSLTSGSKQHQLIVSGKKFAQLNPDERVEAMIRAGYV